MNNKNNRRANKNPLSRSFSKRIISCNGLDDKGFREWVFHPAMLFDSGYSWWGNRAKREKPHEGLDLCYYRSEKGDINFLDEKTSVPVIFAGRVVKVIDDFMGKSVFVSHDNYGEDGSCLYTVYGHIKPYIQEGIMLNEGDIIGTIAAAKKNSKAISHLHISAAWISDTINSQEMSWQKIGDDAGIILLDPLRVTDLPYSISEDI